MTILTFVVILVISMNCPAGSTSLIWRHSSYLEDVASTQDFFLAEGVGGGVVSFSRERLVPRQVRSTFKLLFITVSCGSWPWGMLWLLARYQCFLVTASDFSLLRAATVLLLVVKIDCYTHSQACCLLNCMMWYFSPFTSILWLPCIPTIINWDRLYQSMSPQSLCWTITD